MDHPGGLKFLSSPAEIDMDTKVNLKFFHFDLSDVVSQNHE